MKAQILKDGSLKITANNHNRSELKDAYEQGGYPAAENYVQETLGFGCWEFIEPADIGALTSSPILGFDGDVWWFPNYQITDPWQELKNRGRVIFDPEENNRSLPKKANG